jgi:hypothetical protein
MVGVTKPYRELKLNLVQNAIDNVSDGISSYFKKITQNGWKNAIPAAVNTLGSAPLIVIAGPGLLVPKLIMGGLVAAGGLFLSSEMANASIKDREAAKADRPSAPAPR